jgi:hypothetical protein
MNFFNKGTKVQFLIGNKRGGAQFRIFAGKTF